LHAQLLDRRRPLWRMFLLEGLADGGCALYMKIHHAAVDGAAGVALAQALLDTSPNAASAPAAIIAAAPPEPPSDLDAAQLLESVLVHNGRAGLALVRRLPALALAAGGLLRGGGAGALTAWARRFDLAPPTIFNRSIDSARSIATLSTPLAQVRSIAAAREVTVNDVVLAVVGGGLRRFLAERGQLPPKPLLAAMPVSLRESGDTRMNTQAWMAQANLATDIAEPVQRLLAIHSAAAVAKSMTREVRPALNVSLPSIGLPWLLTGAAALYGTASVAERLPRLANVVVSNVPGPSQPLYLAGARLLSYWPLSIVEHGLGLNVTVIRYVDSLDFGLVAARKVLADPAPLVQAMRAALDELSATAPPVPPQRRRAAGARAAATSAPAENAAARSRAARAPRGARRRVG
jgi:WS/DGAT/MGAT family acyltransferase